MSGTPSSAPVTEDAARRKPRTRVRNSFTSSRVTSAVRCSGVSPRARIALVLVDIFATESLLFFTSAPGSALLAALPAASISAICLSSSAISPDMRACSLALVSRVCSNSLTSVSTTSRSSSVAASFIACSSSASRASKLDAAVRSCSSSACRGSILLRRTSTLSAIVTS